MTAAIGCRTFRAARAAGRGVALRMCKWARQIAAGPGRQDVEEPAVAFVRDRRAGVGRGGCACGDRDGQRGGGGRPDFQRLGAGGGGRAPRAEPAEGAGCGVGVHRRAARHRRHQLGAGRDQLRAGLHLRPGQRPRLHPRRRAPVDQRHQRFARRRLRGRVLRLLGLRARQVVAVPDPGADRARPAERRRQGSHRRLDRHDLGPAHRPPLCRGPRQLRQLRHLQLRRRGFRPGHRHAQRPLRRLRPQPGPGLLQEPRQRHLRRQRDPRVVRRGPVRLEAQRQGRALGPRVPGRLEQPRRRRRPQRLRQRQLGRDQPHRRQQLSRRRALREPQLRLRGAGPERRGGQRQLHQHRHGRPPRADAVRSDIDDAAAAWDLQQSVDQQPE